MEINELKNWFNANKLSLNLKKTKLMSFGQQRNAIPVQITIDNITIERVNQNVFLGVIIDEKVSWKPHICYLRTKVAKCVGIMRRASHALNCNALLILYHSLVMSYLTYCIEVWGNCYKSHLMPLIVLQKRAIRIVHGAQYYDHTTPLFLQSSVLKLRDHIDYKTAQIMFKASKNSLSANIQHLFHDRDAHHTYNLRGSNKFYQTYSKIYLKIHVSFCTGC